MAVAVQMPTRREEKDPLDTIVKGLHIASSIYGIKDGAAKAEALKAQQAREADAFKAQQEQNAFNNQVATAKLQSEGFVKQQDGSFARPEGWRDIKKEQDLANLMKTQAETEAIKKGKGPGSIDAMTKGLEYQIKQLQLGEAQKKSGEIEGPKALAATYGRRMEESDRVMAELAAAGYDRAGGMDAARANMPEAMQGDFTKRQGQAERNFLNAVLRRESGAAISPSEFESGEKQYFDRYGDSTDTKLQKAQARAQAILGLKSEAGHAWDKIQTAQPTSLADAIGKLNANKGRGGGVFNNSANASGGVSKESLESLSDADLDAMYRQATGAGKKKK